MTREWWQDFFDQSYVDAWGPLFSEQASREDAAMLLDILAIGDEATILDAPCGYGRVSRPLADLGVRVLGIDQSRDLLAKAEADRGRHSQERLRYVRHDLREPLGFVEAESFDAAVNLFSSIGYGTDDDDIAIFSNIARVLKPGAPIFIDTMHRDAVIARYACDEKPGARTEDGTELWEERDFDARRGIMNTTWFWKGPKGRGQKSACLRIYCLTELGHILDTAGFDVCDVRRGISKDLYVSSPEHVASRAGVLARRR